ncbi:MAG: adenylate/guanylate cyclase domain-containing protein [Candidatus Competibacteraceae bacterium]|nr:adenylate/guanylate cyclase domain-containing protein [Candidatus Competibacteraceae bacterium]
MTKYTKLRLGNCIKAGFLGAILTIFSILEEGDFKIQYPIVGFISGFFTGVFELFVYRERLRKLPFIIGLFIKSTSYTITVYALILLALSLTYKITGNTSAGNILDNFMKKESIMLALQAFKGSVFIVFLFQLDTLLGDGAFRRYVFGKYHIPRKQDMVFMFLDIKSSTKLAEMLGDENYYSLIDDFFHDISEPIIDSDAEIYKYVGDEVIICWPIEKGLAPPTAVDLFFNIKQKIRKRKDHYIARYGVIPEFKAGIHEGSVISALIGDIRKEIVYNGDVLNTTARLQEICNEQQAELLISDSLYHKLKWTGRYTAQSLGVVQLKGKLKPIEVFSINEH